ncbi:MAG: hypothetical protein MZU91_02970 [Desulfosudis oleivorans]|nr:hypothetical protein [Desulfosudis oleivorans]
MFVFEDLINIDNRGIQTILKEITNEDLSLALKTSSETLKGHILKNMSSRRIRDAPGRHGDHGPGEALGRGEPPSRTSCAWPESSRLPDKIVIGGKGGEDVLV